MESSRFKFRVWNKKSKRYTGNNASYSIDESGLLHVHIFGQHYELENTEDFEVEQCTSHYDINNILIYESDIIRDKNGVYYKVFWSEKGILVQVDGDYMPEFPLTKKWIEAYKVEIVGNIHEIKD